MINLCVQPAKNFFQIALYYLFVVEIQSCHIIVVYFQLMYISDVKSADHYTGAKPTTASAFQELNI